MRREYFSQAERRRREHGDRQKAWGQIMRKLTVIENLVAMLPEEKAKEPVFAELRQVIEMLRASENGTAEHP